MSVFRSRKLIELASILPNIGVGSRVQRRMWLKNPANEDCYWTITRVRAYKGASSKSAWGTLTWRGEVQFDGREKQINGAQKSDWVYVMGSGRNSE